MRAPHDPPPHPAEYSPEVLAAFEPWVAGERHVHDPFGGRGVRLGRLCDRFGVTFTATDIESYDEPDPRVVFGDAADRSSYPLLDDSIIATSPPYLNGISSDYKDGPTARTNRRGRLSYGISLGRALHPRNLARRVIGGINRNADGDFEAFWAEFATIVDCWGGRVLLNIDNTMCDRSTALLEERGYRIVDVERCFTKRNRQFANGDSRPLYEVVLVATRDATWTRRQHVEQLDLFGADP
jgi:hypothetical protein